MVSAVPYGVNSQAETIFNGLPASLHKFFCVQHKDAVIFWIIFVGLKHGGGVRT